MSRTGCVLASVSKVRLACPLLSVFVAMSGRVACSVVAALATLSGCQPVPAEIAPEKPSAGLERYVLTKVPADISHRTFIDFEGKAHLIGYDLEPQGKVSAGTKLALKLYWQSQSKLGQGWKLFTHLLGDHGEILASYDDVGPLRQQNGGEQALGPSKWQPGHIYIDEQSFEVVTERAGEKTRRAPSSHVTVAVGIFNDRPETSSNQVRLDVTSGPQDNQRRGLVARIIVTADGRGTTEAPSIGDKSKKPRRPKRANRRDRRPKTTAVPGDRAALRRAALKRARERRDARQKAQATATGKAKVRPKADSAAAKRPASARSKPPAKNSQAPARSGYSAAAGTKSQRDSAKTHPKTPTPTGQAGKPAAPSTP